MLTTLTIICKNQSYPMVDKQKNVFEISLNDIHMYASNFIRICGVEKFWECIKFYTFAHLIL